MGTPSSLSLLSLYPATGVFSVLIAYLAYQWVGYRHHQMPISERQKVVCLFAAVWAVYLSNFRWRGSGDVVADSLLPFSILQNGTIYLDRFTQTFLPATGVTWVYSFKGHTLSFFSSANGIALIPFYALHVLFKASPTDLLIHQLQKIGASFYVAASAAFLFVTLKRSVTARWALLLSAAYAFGTSSWSTSSQAIWQHGPSQFFLSVGLYALLAKEESPWSPYLAGFALAMAVWCRYTDILLYLPVWLCLVIYSPRKALRFTLGSLLPVMAILGDNVLHSGHLFVSGQNLGGEQNRFFTPLWLGTAGLLVSPGRGLLLFSPFLAAGIIGGYEAVRKPGNPLYRFMALGAVLNFSLFAKWYDWGGGWSYGTRNLADLGPYLVLFIPFVIPSIEKNRALKRLFLLAIGYSIVMHAFGAYLTWWWEDPPVASVWSGARYPVIYLLGKLCKS